MSKLSFNTTNTVDCCMLCPFAIFAVHNIPICSHNDVSDYTTSRALYEENCDELTPSCPAVKRQKDYSNAK